MKTPILLALLSTSATALPLLGGASSIYEGGFCKAYKCNLIKREEVESEVYPLLIFSYSAKKGVLEVGRLPETKAIQWARWSGNFEQNMVNNFTRSFVGLAFEPSAVKKCLNQASARGYTLLTGSAPRQGQGVFDVTCNLVRGAPDITISFANPMP